ncbi:PotD/PotF family extracellular solute-binding protein [Phenylobacterium sp.]|uniref:ABC transporter substrate-binding protein n=1 Tax=Phenylobacterium sp. TaxID=1871053 RepID=UPI0035AEE9C6
MLSAGAAAAGLGLGLLSGCSPGGSAAGGGGRSLRVSAYGGNFEEAMKTYVYPVFTAKTGIRVDSQPQPAGVQFLLQLIEANKAGQAPMDVCIAAATDVMRGRKAGLWRTYDAAKLTNLGNLTDNYIAKSPQGIDGVGALGWYMTMVTNPNLIQPDPTSWEIFWDPKYPNAWGLSGGGQSGMYEITAQTYFGGTEILNTEDGIRQVAAKMAGLKPNTKLWWESEGTMQTALENGEVKGGVYFADVAQTLKASGTPLKVIYPKEGPVIDFGSWCQPTSSTKTEEALEFINFMLTPEAQGLVCTKVHAPPLIRQELLTVSPEELAKTVSPVPPIAVNLQARFAHLDFMVSQFTAMVAS